MAQMKERFNYQIFGEETSPKCVFLHGIMGQGRNWQSIAKRFSNKFQCLIYDQRGHGKSFHPETHEEFGYRNDLKQLLSELGWNEPIYLVGHSMGGRVALSFADEFPELVKALVIVDIGPASDWQSMSAILEKLDYVPAPFQSRGAARDFMENDFLKKYPNKMIMEFFYSNLVDRNGQYDWTFSKPLIRQTLESSRHIDRWDAFKNLKMPSLLIRGELSPDLSRADFEKVVANNPHLQGVEVAGAGHWVHSEKPMETIRIIGDFFKIAGA